MSANFVIVETDYFKNKIKKEPFKSIYDKITTSVYPQLRLNPFWEPNIKKLKGEYSDFYRYRIGPIRLFYAIYKKEIIVLISDIGQRKDSY